MGDVAHVRRAGPKVRVDVGDGAAEGAGGGQVAAAHREVLAEVGVVVPDGLQGEFGSGGEGACLEARADPRLEFGR
ncbi:hypothetical protein [Streptomyces sp. NPDC058579]|uniref:hypothetical protein n=1 Tax=Streptomyces sp. NPDC058579 TaxID=3346548 RepID=UPI0036653DEC